jgi:hypothetical protein
VIIGIVVIGFVVFLASRSGAKRGAQDAAEDETFPTTEDDDNET